MQKRIFFLLVTLMLLLSGCSPMGHTASAFPAPPIR